MTTRRQRDQLRANAPIASRMHNAPESDTVEGLPFWIRGLSYYAEDDTIALRLFDLNEPLLMTSEEAIALTGALLRLVDQSAKNREIIDVEEPSPYPDGPGSQPPGPPPDWMPDWPRCPGPERPGAGHRCRHGFAVAHAIED